MPRRNTAERVQDNQRDGASIPTTRKRGPRAPERWRDLFLEHYRTKGTIYKAAKVAGVAGSTVYDALQADASFAADVEEARQEYADSLEEGMHDLFVNKNNVVAGIVMLKKHRPQDFIERVQQANITVNVDAHLDHGEAATFLASLMGSATPATQRELAALTQSPRALPAGPERSDGDT